MIIIRIEKLLYIFVYLLVKTYKNDALFNWSKRFLKGYEFLPFSKNMGKGIGKNLNMGKGIGKNLSEKYK